MAPSIQDLIGAKLDAAVQQNKLDERDRSSVSQFLGLSGGVNERGARRYYLNGQLSEYVDIAPGDVVDEIELAGDSSPLVIVLARGDAKIQHHVDISETTQASFLAGDIATQNLSQARVAWPDLFSLPFSLGSWAWGCMPRSDFCWTPILGISMGQCRRG
ncbi:MAG TPA: hypothetical protein VFI42_21325 [Thermomicrobiaceae bacterium]|nr:hypothetical protein [Thermomicrobiaceae bacterium]